MDNYSFDNKIDVLQDLSTLNIPELSDIFKLETNPYYFESITSSENTAVDNMILGFDKKQKFIGQVNQYIQLKPGDKIVEYWVDGSVEIVGTKVFNSLYTSNPFKIFFRENTQLKFYDMNQLKSKLTNCKTRYFFAELITNHDSIIYICFDTLLKESFYISFSQFKLDLDEFDLVQAIDYFSAETGYVLNSEKNLKCVDSNNPDSIMLLTWFLLTFKTSDLHKAVDTIIKSEKISAIGYTILKTWIWYNYLSGLGLEQDIPIKLNNYMGSDA